MSVAIFLSWILMGVVVGVLAGVAMKRGGFGLKGDVTLGLIGSLGAGGLFRAVGMEPEPGLGAMAVMAGLGAMVPISVQRALCTTRRLGPEKSERWWRFTLGAAVVSVVAWMAISPVQQRAAIAAAANDRAYTVTPAAVRLTAGIVTGEVKSLRVTQRVEEGSGRALNAAKLAGIVVLKNSSTDQSVRLVAVRIRYVDTQGHAIALEDRRGEPVVTFAGHDWLEPGQEATQLLDVEFPAAALKTRKLGQIRLDLTYVPARFHAETTDVQVVVEEAR